MSDLSIQPVTAEMKYAVIYKEPESEPKYFDIETPLYLVDGKWKRYNPILAYFDLAQKKAKELTGAFDVEFKDGVMILK